MCKNAVADRHFIFEETLFTNNIKRFPFFSVDRTFFGVDKCLPAENLQREDIFQKVK